MKSILLSGLIGVSCLSIVGCESTGISVRDPTGSQTDHSLYQMFTPTSLPTTQSAERMKPNARMAVAQIGELAPPEPMLDEMRKAKVFSDVVALPAPTDAGDSTNIKWYCSMAAAEHADYLVVVGGKADTLHEPTALCLFNVTIVACFCVPSETLHADVKAIGAILDVHTGQAVSLRTAQATDWSMVPTAMIDTSMIDLLKKTRDEAAQNLGRALVDEAKRT